MKIEESVIERKKRSRSLTVVDKWNESKLRSWTIVSKDVLLGVTKGRD